MSGPVRLHVRRAGPLDTGPIADLLNEIIAIGGTTALTRPRDRAAIGAWMSRAGDAAAWHVAEDAKGTLLGFQLVAPHPDLPPEACDIATFVRTGHGGVGIGSRLFEVSEAAARALGYRWINATIRADNAGGLAYYQSRGFETYAHHPRIRLEDGRTVDKVSKRRDLS